MNIPLSPFASDSLVSRDGFSRSVPYQPAHFPLSSEAEYGSYSRGSSRFQRRRPFIDLNCHTPLGQCRVYRVTQMRTNGVHSRESAGTGPLVSPQGKSSNGCCHFAGHHGPINVRLLFSHTHYWYELGMLIEIVFCIFQEFPQKGSDL